MFLRLLEAAELPEPVSEFQVRAAGHRYRIDCAYPGPLVAIELDGHGHEEPWKARSDARRDAHLEAAGWIVLRYTWPQFSRAPDEVVAEVRAVLVARGALPALPSNLR